MRLENIILAIIITSVMHSTISIPLVNATECSDIVKEIRATDLDAFDRYPQLNDMKQDILLILYGRERGTCPDYLLQFSSATQSFMLDFNEAYSISEASVNGSDHIKVVEDLIALKESADQLTEMQENAQLGTEGDDIVSSANEGIKAFLHDEAENYFSVEAEKNLSTRDRISYYKEAALAYREADESLEAVNYQIRADALEERYNRDIITADNLHSTGLAEYNSAVKLESQHIISKINGYILSRDAMDNFKRAEAYYEYHQEEEKLNSVKKEISDLKEVIRRLTNAIAIYFALTAIVLIVVISFLISRLKRWSRDTYDITLGSELIGVREHEI